METLFNYYGFSDFLQDKSEFYNGNKISFKWIKDELYLVFEEFDQDRFKLYFIQAERNSIGKQQPMAANLLIEEFDRANKEHRETVQLYLDYN
jgi:hypothetical protein